MEVEGEFFDNVIPLVTACQTYRRVVELFQIFVVREEELTILLLQLLQQIPKPGPHPPLAGSAPVTGKFTGAPAPMRISHFYQARLADLVHRQD